MKLGDAYEKSETEKRCFAILEILRLHTDADHRLNQKEIATILARDYNIEVNRKTVKRNLTG